MNVLDIILGTPAWVWLVLVYLIIFGVKALFKHDIPLWRLSIMPAVFILWSLQTVYYKQSVNFGLIWLGALIVGLCVGVHIVRRLKIKGNVHKAIIHWPGSYLPLIMSLVFFGLKYALGVMYSINYEIGQNALIVASDIGLTGFISGISLGQFLTLLYNYITIKKVNEEK